MIVVSSNSTLAVPVNAAAYASIRYGLDYLEAIEGMETGRFIVWSQVLSVRVSSDDALELQHPSLVSDMNKILRDLRDVDRISLFPPLSSRTRITFIAVM